MKIYRKDNVLEAAKKRVSWLFDEFPEVMAAFSGGKDSTVVLELGIEEARRRGQLPFKVLFIDQEAEWAETVAYAKRTSERPEVEMYWYQMPFKLENAASFSEEWLYCWDQEKKDVWIHSQQPFAIKENKFGTDEFYKLFDKIYPAAAKTENYAVLYGLRSAESPLRSVAMTSTHGYKDITWATKAGWKKDPSYKFGIIYDWAAADVWTAIARHGWDYNKNYNYQFQYGISPLRMRVSSLTHGIAAENTLRMLQEIEPETYEKLVRRLPGIDTYSKLQKDIRITHLPEAFSSWEEYVEYITLNLLSDQGRAGFEKLLKNQQVKDIPKNEEFWKNVALQMQANDYYGVRMQNLVATMAKKAYSKERKYAK